jgi:hypothetical protein
MSAARRAAQLHFHSMARTRGFTVLESTIWIATFVLVMGGISSAMLFFYRTSNTTFQGSVAITSAQQGIDRMMRVIREAAYSSNGAYPIVSLAANDIVFYADIDTDSAIERVHYYLSGTSIMRGVLDPTGDPPSYTGTETTSVVATNVRNTAQSTNLFTFYNASGTIMTDLGDIGALRFVGASVVVDVDTNRLPAAVTIRSSAALRNLITR